MSRVSFRVDAGRARIKRAVAEIEEKTSAELVVAVHPASSGYPAASWLAGTVLAAAWLLVFLYHPEPFDFTYLPLEIAGWFLLGFFVARSIPTVKRVLVRKKTRALEVERASKVVFVDLGITKTRARSGLLVFVSLLEREVRILRDAGVPQLDAIASLSSRLADSVRRDDVEGFCSILAELGPALAEPLPRGADDENELPDAPEEAA
jgi:putative membrane protein